MNMNMNNLGSLNLINSNIEQHPPRKGRRKINIEFIEDKSRRLITFSKRKAGIMKKAYELATLTGTQVLLLVASETGHVYTFATPTLQPLITQSEGKGFIQTCLNSDDIGYEHFQIPDEEEIIKDSRLLKPRPEKAISSSYGLPSPTSSYSYPNSIYGSSLPMPLPYNYQYSNLQPLQLSHNDQKQLDPPRLDYSFLGTTSHLGVGQSVTSSFNESTRNQIFEKPVSSLKQEEGTDHEQDPDQGMNEKVRFTPGGFYSNTYDQDQLHLESNFL